MTGSDPLGIDMALEVVTLPVADVDRAKAFYLSLGWRLDADIRRGEDFRVVQFTPPHSPASIHFGRGLSEAAPGSVDRIILAVEDIVAARADLLARGVAVSDVDDTRPADSGEPSYFLYASFNDPDGNGWLLQQITTRRPGREWSDIDGLAELLHETEGRHGAFEAAAPPHNWWDWYAAYLDARQRGRSPDDASAAADRYLADVKHVVKAQPPG